jgi:hypothetical protein
MLKISNYKTTSFENGIEINFNFEGRQYTKKIVDNDFPILSYGRLNYKSIFENYNDNNKKNVKHDIKFIKYGTEKAKIIICVHTGVLSSITKLINKKEHIEYSFILEPEKNQVVSSISETINNATKSVDNYFDKMSKITAFDVIKKLF